jgi:hypothetical protein
MLEQRSSAAHLLCIEEGGQTSPSRQIQIHHQQIDAPGDQILPGQATSKFRDYMKDTYCPCHTTTTNCIVVW